MTFDQKGVGDRLGATVKPVPPQNVVEDQGWEWTGGSSTSTEVMASLVRAFVFVLSWGLAGRWPWTVERRQRVDPRAEPDPMTREEGRRYLARHGYTPTSGPSSKDSQPPQGGTGGSLATARRRGNLSSEPPGIELPPPVNFTGRT